ncbi:VIT1/CCC1 transporter family protein, partial [Actinomycetospora sp.]|uniref:VIT1/CCC1 transporter family protein n=1 Tax=Actinomycetospora sp. TaxID=1872135 RepID=UPI002F40CE5D
AFTLGGILPLLAILLPPADWRVGVAYVAVLIALGLAGWVSARLGGSPVGKAVLRVVAGGALGLAVTYGIGNLVGTAVG